MSDSDTTPPSPPTRQSATTEADRVPRRRRSRATVRARPRRRGTSLPPTRRRNFSFRRTESKHPNATRRKSCCERWFRWGSKKRKKKCKKKCKTRKKKRKKRTRKKKRKKRTKKKE